MKKKQNYRLVTIYIVMIFLLVSSSFSISFNKIANAVVVEDIEIGSPIEENDSSSNKETEFDIPEEEEKVEQKVEEKAPNNPLNSATLGVTIESPVEGDLFNDKKVEISGTVIVPIPELEIEPDPEGEPDPDGGSDPNGVPDSGGEPAPDGGSDQEGILDLGGVPDLGIIPEQEGFASKKIKPKFGIAMLMEDDAVIDGVTESENTPEQESTPESENTAEQESTSESENTSEPELGNRAEAIEATIELYEIVTAEAEMDELFLGQDERLLGIIEVSGTGELGEWSFTPESEDVFSDGEHKIYAIVKDEFGNSEKSDVVTFSVDTIRPFVWIQNLPYDQREDGAEFISFEADNLVTYEDSADGEESAGEKSETEENEDAPKISCPPPMPNMTRVCLDTSIVIFVEDNNSLYDENGEIIDNLKVTDNYKPLIRLYSSDDNEEIEYNIETTEVKLIDEEKEKKLVKITLTLPKDEDGNNKKWLKPFTTYYVSAGAIMDKAGNRVHARIWKFTTGNEKYGVVFDEQDPHGNYQDNVNFCVNCHSAHAAEKEQLITGKSPSKEAYFCNSCHDGTVAQPDMPQAHEPDNMKKGYNHPSKVYETAEDTGEHIAVDKDLSEGNGSCSTCHDPHLTWNEENPNLLKSHYIFPEHELVEGYDLAFDSQVVLCETCHYDGSEMTMRNGDKVRNGYEVKNAEEKGVIYEVFQYKDSSTLERKVIDGNVKDRDAKDYSLCLRCHFNPDTKNINSDIKDINQYYSDTDSGHFIKAEKVKDRSPFSFYMPCAECHDTHGASNKKLLKNELGHEYPKEFNEADGNGDINWNPELEKKFCLTCHNTTSIDENKKTLIFGIDAKFDETIEDHGIGEACSACHGGDSKSFIEAVHAPQKLTK